MQLHKAEVEQYSQKSLDVILAWSTELSGLSAEPLTVFVHVQHIEDGDLIGQDDREPASGLWPTPWWRSGIVVADRHHIELSEPFDPGRHRVLIGLYPSGRPEVRWLPDDGHTNFAQSGWPVPVSPKP